MSWTALGRNPVPGDVGAVDRLTSSFTTVADRSEDLLGALRRIDGAAGDGVWRGPAAEDFRRSLADVGPGLMKLSGSYRTAQRGATAYATALADAQELARRAESDAEHALADRAAAEARRRTAGANADSHAAARRAAQVRIVEAQALQLTTAVIADPGYGATVADFERQVRDRYNQARDAEARARHDERVAQDDVHEADQRVDRARRLGDEAADDHRQAKDAFIRALRDAGDGAGGHPDLVHRVWREMQRSMSVQLAATRDLGKKSWNHVEKQWGGDGGKKKNKDDDDKRKTKKDGQDEKPQISVTATASRSGSAELHNWETSGHKGIASGSADAQAWGVDGTAEAGIGRLDDGSYGTALGVSGSAYALRGQAKGRVGNDRFGVEGKVDAQAGARGQAGVDVGFGKNRAKASGGVDAFVGGEAGGEAGVDVGGVKPTVSGKVQYGLGATVKADVGYSNGKFKVKGELGLAFGLGIKGGGGVEVDVPKVADTVGDAGKAAFGFAQKSIGSFHAPW